MQQTYVIEPHTGDKGVLHKILSGLWKLVLKLVVIANDRQDPFGRDINRYAVRDFKTRNLAVPLMLKAFDVQLAIALVDLAVAILRVDVFR